MHKFLLLAGDSDFALYEELVDESVRDKIYYCNEPHLMVVEGIHPEFEDNCVCLEERWDGNEVSVFKDKNGMLIYFTDMMTKIDLINAFE